jgi:hypothetical protein
MQFHEHLAFYNCLRKSRMLEAHHLRAAEWYDREVDSASRRGVAKNPTMAHVLWRMIVERAWVKEERPYYNVWPLAEGALTRLRLNTVDSRLIRLPLPALLVRFAVDHEVRLSDGRKMASVLAGGTRLTDGRDAIMLLVDTGQRQIVGHSEDAIFSYRSFALEPGKTIEEMLLAPVDLYNVKSDPQRAHEWFAPAIRLVCTLCLLEQDPDLVEPDVLADDRGRYEETRDPALVARAVRRGRRGWNIGARLNVSPHWRRPHLALRWTGHGRTIPRIVPVKGALVRLHVLKQVPTGRLG